MKRKQILFSVLLLFSVVATQAARVDTVMVKSPSMNKEVQVVYVLPDKALGEEAEACPVVYLLHGYGGNARSWVGLKPELPKIADEKGIIFVCPDGKNSWYWDSPKNQAYRYEWVWHNPDSLPPQFLPHLRSYEAGAPRWTAYRYKYHPASSDRVYHPWKALSRRHGTGKCRTGRAWKLSVRP